MELAGSAAQNRFNLLFRKFIQVFTTANHPLVLFLDDLQWADSASLKLIGFLMAESQQGYLLILGAYRDNEVSPTHPLMRMLADIPSYDTISLAPLDRASINQLVVDTLTCSPAAAQPLTEWVYQKTQGNPFLPLNFSKPYTKRVLSPSIAKWVIGNATLPPCARPP
uniref:ATP-binding protein n=1 Tax=Desertifilum tharense IPPAS B-1220 TaxID=1781255 RepID=A0ACD5GVS0_9CYAN